MKVYIGPYKDWIGPYQIAELLQKVGVSQETCNKIGKWLSNTWVKDFCQWIQDKKKIKTKIRIDNYDTWSMDFTLSKIIYPMLKKFNEEKHGAPPVSDEDVPEGIGLRSTEAAPVEKWEDDDNFFKRWDWVLGEMIWSFQQIHDDLYDDSYNLNKEERDQYYDRLQNGLNLFAKYYMNLWD